MGAEFGALETWVVFAGSEGLQPVRDAVTAPNPNKTKILDSRYNIIRAFLIGLVKFGICSTHYRSALSQRGIDEMIAKLIPGSYDIEGKPTGQPRTRHGFRPTFPMESYVTQPLNVRCASLGDIRSFLVTCRYVTDEEQFGSVDYWMPPEDFEKTKQGDCEDFALWAWRQLLALGYESRYVVGHCNRTGGGHAWLTFKVGDDAFVLEPTWSKVSASFPQFHTLFLRPRMSVSWDGTALKYFHHEDPLFVPGKGQLASMLIEATAYWVRYRILWMPRILWRTFKRIPAWLAGVHYRRIPKKLRNLLKVDSFLSISHNRWRRRNSRRRSHQ